LLREHLDSPARRLVLLGLCVLVPLVFAIGVAWACVPTARVAISKASGTAGAEVTMTGSGFPANTEKAEIRWETSGGAVLKETPTFVSGAANDEKAFTTTVAIPATAPPGAYQLVLVLYDAGGNVVAPGQAPAAVYQVTDPSLSLQPSSGRPGTRVTVNGAAFKSGEVKIRWGSPGGPELGSANTTGAAFTFSKQVTIPSGPTGSYQVFAVPFGDPADSASAPFRVTPPPAWLQVMPPDKTGPAILGSALTGGNRTLTVSRKREVRVFCGRFAEPGVTGFCGATSARRLKISRVGGAARSAALKLRPKRFLAEQGRPVRIRFRLSRSAMRMLKRAKKVRMRGTVDARDASGNLTKAPFRFTLKAPKARK